ATHEVGAPVSEPWLQARNTVLDARHTALEVRDQPVDRAVPVAEIPISRLQHPCADTGASAQNLLDQSRIRAKRCLEALGVERVGAVAVDLDADRAQSGRAARSEERRVGEECRNEWASGK